MKLKSIRRVSAVREHLEGLRWADKRIGVVLTMGALHEGHLSLVREAARRNDEVIVTVFVNPIQFGPGEDFSRYPRDLASDTRLAAGAGATLVFAPSADDMYPGGATTRVSVAGLSEGLCGAGRPGHFDGVATIVAKFFNVIGSASYYFGKKDFQQCKLIEALARDLLFPVDIVTLATVREGNGLAMSSRNAFLSSSEREQASSIFQSLGDARRLYRGGERRPNALLLAVREQLKLSGLEIEYVELRDATTFAEVGCRFEEGASLLLAVAVRLGKTRLIDNLLLSEDEGPKLFSGTSVAGKSIGVPS